MCHTHDRLLLDSSSAGIPTGHSRLIVSDGHPFEYFWAGDKQTARGRIIVAVDALGPSPFYEDVATTLASDGFYVVAPNYFGRMSQPSSPDDDVRRVTRKEEMDEARIVADFTELADEFHGDNGPVGVLGFCLGGIFALDVAAETPSVAAAVTYYGFVQGHPGRSRVSAPAPLDLVDRITIPTQMYWGTNDSAAYDPVAIGEFVKRSKQAGRSPRVEFFPDAEHSFLRELTATEPSPNRSAAVASWQMTRDFFRDTLAAEPA